MDITTIEILGNGSMKQIHVAEGGPMGGNKVDEKFYTFMSDMLGDGIWQNFIRKDPSGFYDFRLSLERAKKKLPETVRHSGVKDDFQITVSKKVITAFEEKHGGKINGVLEKMGKTTGGKVKFSLGKLVFKGEILRSMMKESVDEIIQYVSKVIKDVRQIGRIVHAAIRFIKVYDI